MSHKFRKPKPISAARRAAARANGAKSQGPVTPEGKAKSALNAITHGLTAGTLVLTTESKDKYQALLASYRERCNPDGPIENDLVEEIVAAKWQERRVAAMIAALIDVAMDRMEKEIRDEFENIDNAARSALAFDNQAKESATLALLNRYATRHARDYHRALRHLREIQSERPPDEKSQNEPKPDATPEPSTTSEHKITAPDCAPETGHRPPSTDHYEAILPNESKPDLTPEPSTISDVQRTAPELVTGHSPLATPTGHRPLATAVQSGWYKGPVCLPAAPSSPDRLPPRHRWPGLRSYSAIRATPPRSRRRPWRI
jgi:hypothetical protein